MIEIFKTNVNGIEHACRILEVIHRDFQGHEANFDLHDCDRILRIKCTSGFIQPDLMLDFLKKHGCFAEVLEG